MNDPAFDEEPDSTPFPPLYVVLTDGDQTMLMPCKLVRVRDDLIVLAVTPHGDTGATPHFPVGFPHPHLDEHRE